MPAPAYKTKKIRNLNSEILMNGLLAYLKEDLNRILPATTVVTNMPALAYKTKKIRNLNSEILMNGLLAYLKEDLN